MLFLLLIDYTLQDEDILSVELNRMIPISGVPVISGGKPLGIASREVCRDKCTSCTSC
jgi:hypothetical protein